jgi:hypothetical protein
MPDRPASRKYRSEVDHRGKPGSVFQEAHEATRLLEAPRKVRIEAMKRFPALLKQSITGGYSELLDNVRLFMVPGMQHCGRRSGTEHVRHADRARELGRARRGARQPHRRPLHRRRAREESTEWTNHRLAPPRPRRRSRRACTGGARPSG